MTPTDIKAAIAKAGTTQSAIAAYLKVSKSSVYNVVNGSLRSTRIEAELEKITGAPIHQSPPPGRGRKKSVWLGVAA